MSKRIFCALSILVIITCITAGCVGDDNNPLSNNTSRIEGDNYSTNTSGDITLPYEFVLSNGMTISGNFTTPKENLTYLIYVSKEDEGFESIMNNTYFIDQSVELYSKIKELNLTTQERFEVIVNSIQKLEYIQHDGGIWMVSDIITKNEADCDERVMLLGQLLHLDGYDIGIAYMYDKDGGYEGHTFLVLYDDEELYIIETTNTKFGTYNIDLIGMRYGELYNEASIVWWPDTNVTRHITLDKYGELLTIDGISMMKMIVS